MSRPVLPSLPFPEPVSCADCDAIESLALHCQIRLDWWQRHYLHSVGHRGEYARGNWHVGLNYVGDSDVAAPCQVVPESPERADIPARRAGLLFGVTRWGSLLVFATCLFVMAGTLRANGLVLLMLIALGVYAWSYPNVRAWLRRHVRGPVVVADDPDPQPSRLDELDGHGRR